jgi:hypothetical protein
MGGRYPDSADLLPDPLDGDYLHSPQARGTAMLGTKEGQAK